ncbi:MAG: 2-C-methyl-D-erythritol 2,4-cyclodiphosphate synthase [Halieaceae bacterium]|nr:2-C-methyl-D-erythritol 2,4-cyclodiphosphate synthase [Halieaceae bacterium]
MRVGHGFDVHAFGSGDHIVLGGVRIDGDRGLEAHSDGDVALHALCDALLGAAGLGDIGQHFPDTDPTFRDMDSRVLLRSVMDKIKQSGWRVNNIDVTIVAQTPRLSDHLCAMRACVASDCSVNEGQVNFKATTTERLGYVGREEGIACHAVVLIECVESTP